MRIGIMGGSFDPIHNGHLILAEQARVEAGLAQVVFVPTYISPFKQYSGVAEAEKRLAMVRLAVESNPFFSVSDLEIRRGEISYTAETLRRFREEIPADAELCFITGADAFLGIESWSESEYLLRSTSFVAALRPGCREVELDALISALTERCAAKVTKIYSPQVDISSTKIRNLLAEGKSPRYLLPDAVLDYIEAQGLYAPELDSENDAAQIKARITRYIEANLKPSRYLHTVGVVQEAIALAKLYGADPAKAELCALFHDACRGSGNLQHGSLAAELMSRDYHIRDEDMLNAVRYHTTGRAGMSLLEKVIYVADATEPGRSYPGVSELRSAARRDLDWACLMSMEHTIDYVRSQGQTLDENTVRARDSIKNGMK